MDETKTVTIPKRTAICAARHYCYLHEGICQSDELEHPISCDWAWAIACYECSETGCHGKWYEALAPLFKELNIYPRVCRAPKRSDPEER